MGSSPFGKKRWLIKHATGWCGVGQRELMQGDQDHDECPRCGEPETAQRVVECEGTGAEVTFAFAVKQLDERMNDHTRNRSVHSEGHLEARSTSGVNMVIARCLGLQTTTGGAPNMQWRNMTRSAGANSF
jgi:hypothetical protein